MNSSTKIALVAAVVGIVGLSGLAKIVSAAQTQPQQVAIMPQRDGMKMAEASDGDGETNDDVRDQQESIQLQSLAKITPQQAQQFAERVGGGKASSVKLENEDGNLVYAVVVGQQEVKVDAGNGKVLYTDKAGNEQNEGVRPRSSIQVTQSNGDGDGETNDDG
jgi:uncharacterized membrane protein YkoI